MPVLSKKEFIEVKYEELKSKLRLYMNDDLFPSLDEYEITDIILFLNLYFPKDEKDHNETIINLMKENEIELNDNDYLIVSSLIINFIEMLNNI